MEETQTTSRTDVHRPAVLVTEDYVFTRAYDSQGGPGTFPPFTSDPTVLELWQQAIQAYRKEMDELRAKVRTSAVGRGLTQCHHCGAHIRYGAVLHHVPTDTYITVGETCLENRFERATEEFHQLRRQAELDRAKQRIVQAQRTFVQANPDLAWLTDEEVPAVVQWNDMVVDIARKFKLYGELSECQVAAVRRVYEKSVERESRPKPVEPEPADAPTGRVEVQGTVLSAQWRETDFGMTLKLLVQVPVGDRAWKLWTTSPSKLGDVEKGTEVHLKVTVQPSNDDPAFAFGKRPTVVA